ncbi:unnamed protein product [Mytilus coruscus]|uniref:Uncharacterized protein n=1 Tax=Mytilus coruscus TaxID=42192 RepID=A0A6J8DRZ6_MYTCO|nr:unnamed protein product [Mytilus coruscus]
MACSKKPDIFKLDNIMEKFAPPENCEMLAVSKVNEEIWLELSKMARSSDLSMQSIQKYIVGGISALTTILETHFTPTDTEPEAGVIILDGSALINTLPPRISKTFEEYAALQVVTKLQTYSCTYTRTDIVFDVYWSSSLQAETRPKRGISARRRVTDKGKIPQNWQSFMRDNSNKTELFNFLADKIVIVNKEESVVYTNLLACKHAAADGKKIILIEAGDTNVLVIAVSVLPILQLLGVEEVWVALGQGKNLR